MKRFVMLLALVAVAATGHAQVRAEVALRAATELETVKGDLKGAISAYRKIADDNAAPRDVRAQALLRMAQCYQKLGDAQAKPIFERLLREFSDQVAFADRARTALRDTREARPNGELTIRQLGVLSEVPNSVSDSGLLAAGTDWDTGNIVVWDLPTGKKRPVTRQGVVNRQAVKRGEHDEFGEEPVFSPDATRVVYTWCTLVKPATATAESQCDGHLRISRVRDDGIDQPRTLYSQGTWTEPLAWSRDGNTIAALSETAGKTADLLLIDATTGKASKVDTLPSLTPMPHAAFSPDSKYLAIDTMSRTMSPGAGQFDVFVYDISAAKRHPVAATTANERLVGWAGDGRRILFSSEATGSYDLYGVAFAQGDVAGLPTLIHEDLGAADPLLVSSNGTLYYSKQSGRVSTVQRATLDFTTGTLTVPVAPAARPIRGFAPRWTRDGSALVYLSRPNALRGSRTTIKVESNGATREIVTPLVFMTGLQSTADPDVILTTGTNGAGEAGLYEVRLSTGKTTLLAAGARGRSVSQDGRHVYFFRGEGARHEFVERDLTTGAERVVLDYQHAGNIEESAYLSPDRARVYYRLPDTDASGERPHSRIIERDLATGRERELLSGRLGPLQPSPDGKYLVIGRSEATDKWRAFDLVPLAGSQEPRELMRLPGDSTLYFLTWSPDSRSVLLQSSKDGRHKNWWIPISGGAPKELARFVGSLSIHPDGKTIAFAVADDAPLKFEIWAMEGLLKRP